MDADNPKGAVRVTAAGDNNVIQARVLITVPVAAGAVVGLATDRIARDALVTSPGTPVGQLMDDFSSLSGGQLNQVADGRVNQ